MGHHGSCSQNSCSTSSDSQKQSSGCGCGCGCGCQKCHCSCHQGKYTDELLHLADEAWMEVLKEKIKEEIRTNNGEHLTQLAKLVSTANNARWKDKLQGKKDYEDFEAQLKNIMCDSCKK